MPGRDNPFPRWAWPLLALLYAFVIPWWLPPADPPEIWLGLPRWVVTALLGGLAVAVTANLLMLRYWRDDPGDGEP